MLVVCALALVVAAAFFLVVGLAAGDVGDLYLSMALCLASLVVAAVSARLSRPRSAPVPDAPPAPVPPAGEEGSGAVDDRDELPEPVLPGATAPAHVAEGHVDGRPPALVPAGVGAASEGSHGDASIWAAAPAPAVDVEARPAAAEPEAPAPAEVEVLPAPAAEVEAPPPADDPSFPIADYDRLAAEQIIPLVPKLWPEEVPVVAARERATKARPAVLDALAEAAGDPSLAFPIAEYESLDTEQITRLLARLDDDDLATVQTAERSGPARVGVLVAVANQLAARR